MKKLVAGLIVMLMMLIELLPIAGSVVLAADGAESAVLVRGYFSKEDIDDVDFLVCDTNESSLKMNFEISVTEKGYLKSAVLKLEDNLNFAIKEDNEVQIKNNEIKVKGISQNEKELISIPIEFKRNDILNSNYLNATNKIVFSGVYVDNNAEEYKIEKEINLKLSWNETTSTRIETSITKNIDYDLENGKGKIIQTLVRVSSEKENSNLPIKNTELLIDIPKLEGMELHDVQVECDKLSYTQGRGDYEIEFSKDNYTINEDKLVIAVGNNEKEGNIYNSYGEDVYIITYVYEGGESDTCIIDGKIDFILNTYTNEEEKKSIDFEYDLTDVTDNTVEYTKDDRANDISKGYLMANSEKEKYEITYEKKDLLNISRADLIDSLEIIDTDEYFEADNKDTYATENETGIMSYYKTTQFSRENLLNILGEEGKVEILNMNDEVISTISLDMETNENGLYIVEYEDIIGRIKIRISKPINDGNISILSTKAIKKLNYSRDIVKQFTKLVNVSEGFATYVEGAVDNLGKVESIVSIKQTKSNSSFEIGQTELSTTVPNESVNFKIRLNNNDDVSDLYENPVFEIRLPQAIREIKIRNIDLFYANNELEIANVENFVDDGFIIIRVTLKGSQSSYNLNKETNGTVISFDVDLVTNEFTVNTTENAEMCYYNANSVGYEAEIDWNMFLQNDNISYLKNGSYIVPLSFKAPEGLLNAQLTETKEETKENPFEDGNDEEKEENKNRVTSVKQGAQAELIEEGASSKLATMYISVMNNTPNKYSNFQILGRIPFAGNKDITTGRDLGTTVDTILDSEIKSTDSNLIYTVYYSPNPEATTDLSDPTNEWSTRLYKTGTTKSYLILLNSDYVLEPNSSLEFEYDYVIPANLSSGDAFFGTYATYYEEESGNKTNSSADEIGYKTLDKTTIEASMNLIGDVVKESSDSEFEVILKNTGNAVAENVDLHLPIMSGLSVGYIKSEEGLPAEVTQESVAVHVQSLKPNEEKKIVVGWNVYSIDDEVEKLKLTANVKADNIDEILVETPEYLIERLNFTFVEYGIYDYKVADVKKDCIFTIANIAGKDMHNVVITKQLSKEISVTDVTLDGVGSIDFDYDQNTGILTFTIPEMLSYEAAIIKYGVTLNSDGLTGNEFVFDSVTTCSYDEENISFTNKISFNLLDVNVKLLNSTGTGYISKDDNIEYVYEVTNNSKFDISDIRLLVQDSENMYTETLDIWKDDKNFITKNASDFESASLVSLKAGQKMIVTTKSRIVEDTAGTAHETLKLSVGNKEFANERNYSIIEDSSVKQDYELTGCAYIDTNKNQIQDNDEKSLPGIIVDLYNSETNEKVDSMITNVSGRYRFSGIENGKYYVRFNYDESEYVLSSQNSEEMIQNKSNVMNINDNYMTDNISIDNKSVGSVDLQLSDEDIFDMKIDSAVEKITVQNNAESNTFDQNRTKLAKIDIDPKLVDGSKVLVEYKITVTNQGTIPGKINKIADYITQGMEFDSSLNPDWYLGNDGNVYTRVLADENINPNEEKELKLVLIKNMTENNTGLVHNTVEIVDAINDKGITDIDSTPGNRLDEDDLSYADAIIGVSTGLPIGAFPIIIVSIVILIPVSVLVWRIIEKRRYV